MGNTHLPLAPQFDVIIIGAGPAGLSPASSLGRCRRRVLICDTGNPRNASSHAIHRFLTRDGIAPGAFLRIGREQLRRYPTVLLRKVEATDATRAGSVFTVTLSDSTICAGRTVLLATGVVDRLPAIAGIETFYGRSVHHCPLCEGSEKRDSRWAAYGRGEKGSGLALMLTLWSVDLVLCSDGLAELSGEERKRLARHGIAVREQRIARLEGTTDGRLERGVFITDESLARRALFFHTGQYQRSPLLTKFQWELTEKGGTRTGEREDTNVPGLYVAGYASRDVQLVIVAAAEGAKAAFAINKALLHQDGLG
jgi:thioredoxin reductase